ncbi:MAG: TonB-dependent receptor, partial [Bacteroidota bacterium]
MKAYLLLLFLALSSQLSAQNQIRGQITNINGDALEFANILLFTAMDSSFVKGAISDWEGQFVLENLEDGRYYLQTSLLAYADFQSEVIQLPTAEMPFLQISLSENAQLLEAVDVVAKKPLFEQQIDRTVVNVQNSITASGATALDILQRSPGIDIDQMSGAIVMQGKQGVVVMINGKRQRMEARALLQWLQSMPADNIEKIELITSPPASYDAEGDAGIINIQTVKQEAEGFNLHTTLNAAYGVRAKYGGSFNANFRSRRWNAFADFSINHNFSQEDNQISRTNVFGEQITQVDLYSSRPTFTSLSSGRIGLDYDLSAKTTLGVLWQGNRRHWEMEATTNTTISDNSADDFRTFLEADEVNDWENWMANFSIRHQWSDRNQLSLDLDYLAYEDSNPVDYREVFSDLDGGSLGEQNFRSNKSTPIDFWVMRLDDRHQFSDQLQTQFGLKGTLSQFTNEVSVSRLEGRDWTFDPDFTDRYEMGEQIGAAYVSMDYQPNERWQAKAGLRYEYYNSDLSSEKEGDILVQSFGRLFPSLFLSYQVNDNNQIQLSYNERISRPAFNDIAPAFFFWGYNTIMAGNPTIRPTISRRLSFSLRNKSALLTAQISHDKYPIAFQPETLEEENLLLIKGVNMEDRQTAMLSFNSPIAIRSWWEARINAAAYWRREAP